jgi:hypothetical protein
MLLIAMNTWAQESSKSELQLTSYEGFKLIDKREIESNRLIMKRT